MMIRDAARFTSGVIMLDFLFVLFFSKNKNSR